MQTFLHYEIFVATAEVLDNKRLGKQRVETLQIIKALTTEHGGWKTHPAVKMWRGHLYFLRVYQESICNEWINVRGYKDTCLEKSLILFDEHMKTNDDDELLRPSWLGNEALHRSHRSNLIRKDAEFYAPRFEDGLSAYLPYVWPV